MTKTIQNWDICVRGSAVERLSHDLTVAGPMGCRGGLGSRSGCPGPAHAAGPGPGGVRSVPLAGVCGLRVGFARLWRLLRGCQGGGPAFVLLAASAGADGHEHPGALHQRGNGRQLAGAQRELDRRREHARMHRLLECVPVVGAAKIMPIAVDRGLWRARIRAR
jgi:hypothetical protein